MKELEEKLDESKKQIQLTGEEKMRFQEEKYDAIRELEYVKSQFQILKEAHDLCMEPKPDPICENCSYLTEENQVLRNQINES